MIPTSIRLSREDLALADALADALAKRDGRPCTRSDALRLGLHAAAREFGLDAKAGQRARDLADLVDGGDLTAAMVRSYLRAQPKGMDALAAFNLIHPDKS